MKTLNEFFLKIYCINLDTRADRYGECVNEFKKIGIIVERISAINGKGMGSESMNINAGAYGLLLTNINIIKNALLNNYSSILILEDDVTFNEKFNIIFNEKIELLPNDWDMLYLGGCHVFDKGNFNLITGNKDFIITKENYKNLNHELCKTTWTQTTHAVALNFKFYEPLLNAINKNMGFPIDRQYCELQQTGFNAYTFLPSIALQRPSFSDIEGTFFDYNKSRHLF